MTTTAPKTAPPGEIPREARLTLAVASLAVLAVFLDTTVLFVAFPDIVATFDSVAPAQLSWVLNAYTIVFAALLVPAGKFADRLGHKRAFLAGSVLFTVASMACGLAPSAGVLIAFRVVQAVGAATLIPSSLALLLRAFPPAKVPFAVAIWGASGAVAGALGPTLGAVLVEAASWRWVFFINLPVGLFTVVAGRRVLRESKDETAILPAPVGVVLIALAAGLVSLGLVQSDSW
ncbi:MAG TPA: MFS transporter, partial [Ilumatobacteraceae bacterium]|nr:MFS transporter [Ilumatobacteraceae bacterium]